MIFVRTVYTIAVELPVLVLYRSAFWSAVFLLFIFSVSVWNGGGFYIEVFGRKCVNKQLTVPGYGTKFNSLIYRFERELEALRKELADVTRSGTSTPTHQLDEATGGLHSRNASDSNISESNATESPVIVAQNIPPTETPISSLDLSSDSSSHSSIEDKKDR